MNNRLTQIVASISPNTLFVGIDVGKKSYQVTIMTEKANIVSRFRIENSQEGLKRLLTQALEYKIKFACQILLFGSEPCSYYFKPLAYYIACLLHREYGYLFKR